MIIIMNNTVLEVKNLSVNYISNDSKTRAVRNVSFDLKKGEFLGIAGESGCGKSTLAFALTKLLPPSAKIISGSINFLGEDLVRIEEEKMRKLRWKEISIVFQAAMNSLNPVLKIKKQIDNCIYYHEKLSKNGLNKRALELFEIVNIPPKYLDAYPHQLSGGMKQRVVIAMALALNPKIVIMDEPTTALDVVVQRMILQQVDELRKNLSFSVIYITHDLSLLVEISDSIAIMYAGQLVEKSPSYMLFTNPLHPYTQGLINSFPSLTGRRSR